MKRCRSLLSFYKRHCRTFESPYGSVTNGGAIRFPCPLHSSFSKMTAVPHVLRENYSSFAVRNDRPYSQISSPIGTERHLGGAKFNICIVGSGPAGFYVAKYLLKEMGLKNEVSVDILDRLPTPFGLVRSGVAPDHPEVKAVQGDFEQVASDSRVCFFGNTCLGQDISPTELRELYDVVVLAYGAAGDRELRIPGADLEGVFSARAFVSWYNGHPDFAHLSEDIHAALSSSDTVAVVGAGNVALDCARVLIKGVDALRSTDICKHALDVFGAVGENLRRVVVLGRRGHVQSSFTIKELRELTKLNRISCIVRRDELEMGRTPASLVELKEQRGKKRIDDLLTKVSDEEKALKETEKKIELRFLVGPSEILPCEGDPKRVCGFRINRNRLELDSATGLQRAVDAGEEREVISCGMVLGSIGYRCLQMEGVPYNEDNATIANDGNGRVTGMPGMYCSGWARRGPSGIIGTNITDARSVVAAVIEDASNGRLHPSVGKRGRLGLEEQLRRRIAPSSNTREDGDASTEGTSPSQVVDWEGYQEINREEVTRGSALGKPREKIIDVGEMLEIAATRRTRGLGVGDKSPP